MRTKWGKDLDWDVILRLDTLDSIRTALQENGDPHKQLDNVEAIIDLYQDGTLKITRYVTYWSRGHQLCQPRPFRWDEFYVLNRQFRGEGHFWVEGVSLESRLTRLCALVLTY